MTNTRTERLIAYLTLFSGLLISAVAEFYSIVGLTAIFPTAFLPIVIMGIALGVGKLVATVWLKQNWEISPWTIKIYLLTAIATLMLITSMGIFGFLSKAHSDQSLVSGDALSKIAIYDEKIKVAKDNIDANRKALKQMDEAVDQVMGRSQDEKGADKAVALRRGQAKERTRLLSEITAEQKVIAKLSEERAPIAAEVRKVEAEVGPVKYIAAFIYGDNTDANVLEKAVTWVIILIVVVFDPMAVILLLASQITFQKLREQEEKNQDRVVLGPTEYIPDPEEEEFYSRPDPYVADVGEKPTAEELKDDLFPTYEEITPIAEGDSPEKESDVVSTATVTESILEQHPYLNNGFTHFEGLEPMVYRPEPTPAPEEKKEYLVEAELIDALEGTVNRLQQENDELKLALRARKLSDDVKVHGYSSDNGIIKVANDTYSASEFKQLNDYIQNEEQNPNSLWNRLSESTRISEEEYIEQASKKQ
jgi:hypothetical protein